MLELESRSFFFLDSISALGLLKKHEGLPRAIIESHREWKYIHTKLLAEHRMDFQATEMMAIWYKHCASWARVFPVWPHHLHGCCKPSYDLQGSILLPDKTTDKMVRNGPNSEMKNIMVVSRFTEAGFDKGCKNLLRQDDYVLETGLKTS